MMPPIRIGVLRKIVSRTVIPVTPASTISTLVVLMTVVKFGAEFVVFVVGVIPLRMPFVMTLREVVAPIARCLTPFTSSQG